MNNILTTQDSGTGSQDIQKSQIYYSPYPRKSLSLKKSSFISGSQLKNMNQSAIQFTTTNPTNATKDIQQNEIGQQRNFNFKKSMTEKVVEEALQDLSDAIRLNQSLVRQQSLVNHSTSFISMSEQDKIQLRKNRIQHQINGLLIQQYSRTDPLTIKIYSIKSKQLPYLLEIKEIHDNKRFQEDQEVFLTYDHISNYYYNMKIYIVEKGSDDAILFAIDNSFFLFETNYEQAKENKIKVFCLENVDRNQLNIFVLQKTSPILNNDSDENSDSSEDELQNENNSIQKQQQNKSNLNQNENQTEQSKNKNQHGKKQRLNMSYTRIQEEKIQKTVKKYIKIARAYSFLGQPEMAINYYNRIFNNKNINKFNVSEVDALEELMFFLEDMEKEAEAIKKADRLLEIYAKLGNIEKLKQIIFFKGNLSIKLGDFKTAEKEYCKLLEYLNLEDGDEISYFTAIAYGKLADIQFIIANYEKCLELLNDKYNTLKDIYRQQDLPQIQEINDDEDEYQQFERNSYESQKCNQQLNDSTNNYTNQQSEVREDYQDYNDSEYKRFQVIEKKFLQIKEQEQNNQLEDDYEIEYLEGDGKSQSKNQDNQNTQNRYMRQFEEFEEEEQEQFSIQQSEESDLKYTDIKNIVEQKMQQQSEMEQSPMLKNSQKLQQNQQNTQTLFYHSCQQSMMNTEILSFHQKILKELWDCSMQIADVYFQQEDIQFSINYYSKSLEFAEKLFGKDSLQVAQLYESIGLVCLENMDFDESLDAFQKSLAIKQKICCQNHPQLAFSYSYLGCLYAKFHMYKQAKEEYQKSLSIYQHKFKKFKKELSETYNNIANIHLNEAEIELAVQSYEKALELFNQLQNEIPTLHFAQIYENLGIAYYQLGQFKKAQQYFQDSENKFLILYDENHHSVARVKNWQKTNQDRMENSKIQSS
ncbi:tetratricopeptide repeat protein (macronuclear) [Tetrahymena thermophila SB210]|uniref:Tetratricopeptide repeat protein n=1 Tax=Tetrahymena thermophila (strain SB210) TaxID=312017 RepID=I7MKJ2_TETTS|nr:tetratricopeptide repeat protein [Tetrahymena thermophila SB210]EAR99374.2 tetratricopeptide repeat protein [Tetrahymena thermophila SB210]|eukprot:XP_001019619.2 tetratricopeptide repeat protein [Tetrahymena thermophila SB210]